MHNIRAALGIPHSSLPPATLLPLGNQKVNFHCPRSIAAFLIPHFLGCLLSVAAVNAFAQSELYPQHFDLEEITLLDSPLKQAMTTNDSVLLEYDVDRLLTPFIRQAGLSSDANSDYYGWEDEHPSFTNWGLESWSLEGHVGGHYLTALALAYAATDDADMKSKLKERLDYMLGILDDCQNAFDGNTEGMEGFLGGQPINEVWTGLYAGDLSAFQTYGGWVPFYCEHKVLAGLRDAWIYTDSELAKELFTGLCDWSVNVVSNLTTTQMQSVLDWEHGGMNETLADAYRLLGDEKYLEAAVKYSHQTMIDGMQSLSTSFLDGKHANTQVPKYIGFERIYQEQLASEDQTPDATLQAAAHNFWEDVATNRTVCIGGNSVSEHFLAASACSQYITNLDGPESCNSNNMLKLSEDLFDETHQAQYADFYEQTMWNHILSTQDPQSGGYVYFTTLRPQSYRIYSQVDQAMWCCVGTGMENHSKYGHFIYTHTEDNDTLFVNLFTASTLASQTFALTQQTDFPYAESTTLTLAGGGSFTLAIRHPHWAGADYAITVNGEAQALSVEEGTASYAYVTRDWQEDDVVEVSLPMSLRIEECPNYTDYIAFKYGPILLAAQTTAVSEEQAGETGLEYEELANEFAGEERMGHAPGSYATSLALSSSPLLIGERDSVLSLVSPTDAPLRFALDAESDYGQGDWGTLYLVPFHTIHHARYSCYFYQQTAEAYAESDMGKADAEEAELNARTIDFVATGEQQSEAGHDASYSTTSSSGTYNNETYRDIPSGGYIQYTLTNPDQRSDSLSILCRFTTADKGRTGTILIDGTVLVEVTIPSSHADADSYGFYNVEYPIPDSLVYDDEGNVKTQFIFRLEATGSTYAPGLYYLRLMSGYDPHLYTFVASEWITGDESRVAQEDIDYDEEANTLTVNASGQNNVCLMLDYENVEYNVSDSLAYLLVSGQGLSLATARSYLWWLNGINQSSSIAPTYTANNDGQRIIAWKLDETGLDDNCSGTLWSIRQGKTIFGLTAVDGTATIDYIGFVSSPDAFLAAYTAIHDPSLASTASATRQGTYTLSGQRIADDTPLPKGIYIKNGQTVAAPLL